MVWESVWNHLEAREGLVGVRADQGRFSLGQPVLALARSRLVAKRSYGRPTARAGRPPAEFAPVRRQDSLWISATKPGMVYVGL